MQPWLNGTTTNAVYPSQEAFFSSKSMFHHLNRPNPRAGILLNLLMWIWKNKDTLPIECYFILPGSLLKWFNSLSLVLNVILTSMIPNWRRHMTVWTQCTLNFSQTWCSIEQMLAVYLNMCRHDLRMNANVLMAWPLLQHYHWFGICTCEPEECQNLTYILYWNWDNTFVLSKELVSTPHLSWTWDLLRAVPSWIGSWDPIWAFVQDKVLLFSLTADEPQCCLHTLTL